VHRLSASFVLGFHGCDDRVAEALLAGESFKQSQNDYDWLGPGVYFWEANPQRGLDFAVESSRRKASSIKKPAVVGAVVDLGLCLDMTTLGAIEMVKAAYESLKETFRAADKELPKNGSDLLLRRLDCAVVQRLHTVLGEEGTSLDTVRGIFFEGDPIYPESGFNSKTHTQIAVRNLACIKGVFRVGKEQLTSWQSPE
jgi:hypothetical protein